MVHDYLIKNNNDAFTQWFCVKKNKQTNKQKTNTKKTKNSGFAQSLHQHSSKDTSVFENNFRGAHLQGSGHGSLSIQGADGCVLDI